MMKSVFEHVEDKHWRQLLTDSVPADISETLYSFIQSRIELGVSVYPEPLRWFRALNEIPIDKVRVVILGQDPYHGVGQAQGLSFSVPCDGKIPPSLRNIYKELESDEGVTNTLGDLSAWSAQGVLLLNAVLTVEQGAAGSHQNKGWELITDQIIRLISQESEHCVFLLWGSYAHKKSDLIDSGRHCILTAPHPSPLSAYRGWFGSKHFSSTNRYLQRYGFEPINWQISGPSQLSIF